MDDLIGSGSSILNGLRDQRSTLKVCDLTQQKNKSTSVAYLKHLLNKGSGIEGGLN